VLWGFCGDLGLLTGFLPRGASSIAGKDVLRLGRCGVAGSVNCLVGAVKVFRDRGIGVLAWLSGAGGWALGPPR